LEDKLEFHLGIDIGAVSIKLAIIANLPNKEYLEKIVSLHEGHFTYIESVHAFDQDYCALLSNYKRIKGNPIKALSDLLQIIVTTLPEEAKLNITFTGVGGKTIAELLKADYVNEFVAIANGVGRLLPNIKTILEIGGDSSKYIRIQTDQKYKEIGIIDYEKNGDCAAGTGSFIDQQATRLLFDIEEVGDIVIGAERTASIAGRCSVFAKSDMIHAQQKGFKPDEILKGLCQAVVRNFRGSITKGKEIVSPVTFIGGVAANKGIVQAVKDIFKFEDDELIVSPYHFWFEALGCAFKSKYNDKWFSPPAINQTLKSSAINLNSRVDTKPISKENVIILRDKVKKYEFNDNVPVESYLGIDIGSVSTKLVVVDVNGDLIYDIYTRTKARPIEVVREGLKQIKRDIGHLVNIIGVGTTGSGRELIGELIGADTIRDEITAHKTGAMNVSEKLTNKDVDTIFDIGGQDSKFISIEKGVVVDFTMNEACAAGTGSFLEEQAEKLGINIKGEFSDLALDSKTPVRLGERCTVFMEKDLIPYVQQGVPKKDLAAGLSYSIVYNYLNRVVRGRKIGNTVYFQGGTAYNDAVASAFASILNKEIIVPPHNGVIGAIGAAILAKEKIESKNIKTTFRGFDIDAINYSFRNFTCKGCSNFCDIQEFNVEGKKTYWGNKCSERFKQNIRSERQPCIENLIEYRYKLLDEYNHSADVNNGPTIGYIKSMYYFDQFPFWSTYFREIGYRIILSDKTNSTIINNGVESLISEPCFPISVAHGHVQNLIEKNVDFIFQPNVIDTETNFNNVYSFLCPWGQVLCFFIKHNPRFKHFNDRLLIPNLRFYHGRDYIKKSMEPMAKQLGITKSANKHALKLAFEAEDDFKKKLLNKGRAILEKLEKCGEKAIVVLGRPYNIYDGMINLNIPTKLREHYGINIIPFDFINNDNVDLSDVNENMYWNYGRKLLQVAKMTRNNKNLDVIYITNFKCGPDSYVKHYTRDATQKPFLTLQFDGHGNDAGVLTRCEAYLDSKGFLD